MKVFHEFVTQEWSEALGCALLHSLWQGALITLAAQLVFVVFSRRSAVVLYATGCVALGCMVLAPAITFLWIVARPEVPAGTGVNFLAFPLPDAAWPAEVSGEALLSSDPPVQSPEEGLAQSLSSAFPLIAAGWLAGVLLASARLFLGWIQVQNLRRSAGAQVSRSLAERVAEIGRQLGLSRPVRMLESTRVEVPTIVGWFRPLLLLPASVLSGLTPVQLEAILAHELAHVRRLDYLVNIVQSGLEVLLFYHPAVWWISARIREEREHCCDDWAVKICGDRVEYAKALATLEDLRAPIPLWL